MTRYILSDSAKRARNPAKIQRLDRSPKIPRISPIINPPHDTRNRMREMFRVLFGECEGVIISQIEVLLMLRADFVRGRNNRKIYLFSHRSKILIEIS